MKKAISVFIVVFILVTIIPVNQSVVAYESQYSSFAELLKVINVFRGTDLGFELDREPTRIEGGVMFVRLLGGENEALARDYYHPFVDVPEWADPYIGFLYQYNLTKGISSSQYGSTLGMQAKSYMTFILRALGYDEASGDFTWENALEYAFYLNLIDLDFYTELKGQPFLRDQVAKVSYDALFFNLKKFEATLGEKLVSQGAIPKVAANKIGIIDEYYMNNSDPISIYGLSIGSSFEDMVKTMGNPNDILQSRLGYNWYIYSFDYNNYVQFGVKDQKIISFYTTSRLLRTDKNISVGNNKDEALLAYTAPVKYIEKRVEGDNTIYLYTPLQNDCDTFILSNLDGYVTYYYDSYSENKIYAAYVIDKNFEESYKGIYLVPKENLITSMEKQTLFITNALRSIDEKKALLWDEKASISATKHSIDMIERNYFAHIDPDGVTPFTRMKNEGINYSLAGENIAYGFYDAIASVHAWYNSKTGHRQNLLDNYDYLGVGVAFKGDSMYITQNMWR